MHISINYFSKLLRNTQHTWYGWGSATARIVPSQTIAGPNKKKT